MDQKKLRVFFLFIDTFTSNNKHINFRGISSFGNSYAKKKTVEESQTWGLKYVLYIPTGCPKKKGD